MAPLVDLRPGAPLISRSEHEASLICGAVALALVVWLLLSSSYLLGAPVWAANFSALAFVFGTGLFHYGTYDSSFTHIYSALGLTLLVWLGLRSRKRMPPAVTVAAIAVTCFFLTAIRNTNLIAILFLLAAASPMPWGGDKRRLPTLRWRVSAAALVGIVAAIILNLAYNYYATHHLSFSTYGDESFFFSRPMQWSVLFSYQRGLLTYYPVLAVGLVAGFWTRRTRLAALWLSGLIAGFVTLYGFWASWFLGGGMGHRGFVELMPLAAIIFAVSLPDLPLERRKPIIILAAAFSFLTLEIMCGYWAGTFPFSDATREVYWSHVAGKNSLLPFQ